MRLLIIRLCLTILDGFLPKVYNNVDEDKMNTWLISLMISDGFKNYFAFRDLQILKTIGNGVSHEEYWKLAGQRIELIHLAGISKNIYERNKKDSGRERASEDD